MCTIFYCGAIIFATHGGVGGHQPLALPNTKYVPTHIEVARAGGCSARTNQLAASHRVCAARFPQSGVRNTFPHTHRDRARRRVQPRTHQLAASRRVCVARFRQAVAADSIVDPPAGLLMQLCSQEAPQYLALQKTKYVRSHIEVARASGCSHAHINSPRPTECAQRDFDSQAPLLRFSTPPPGMLMQLRLQEAPHPAPRTTKNEIRSHTHRGRARRRVQPRTHQLAASRRVCVARFRRPVAADSIVARLSTPPPGC